MKEIIWITFKNYWLFYMGFFIVFSIINYIADRTLPKFIFRLEDWWIGIYTDRNRKIIYCFPIPCIGFKVYYGVRPEKVS